MVSGKTPYVGEIRNLVEINGFIEKRYLSKDKVNLQAIEYSQQCVSTTIHYLLVERKGQ